MCTSKWLVFTLLLALLAGCPSDEAAVGHPDGPAAGGADAPTAPPPTIDAGTMAPPPVDALPATTFVFKRHDAVNADSLVAYDAVTRTERLVTDLVDDGGGTKVTGHAISPDRKSLAFTAIFRAGPGDVAAGHIAEAVWTVSVDGQSFQRLTPPLPMLVTRGSCTTDADCVSPSTCAPDDTCRLGINVSSVEAPAWTADGAKVLFNIGNFTSTSEGISGGTSPWIVSAAGGDIPTPAVSGMKCTLITDTAPDPKGAGFLAVHAICLPGEDEGVYYHKFDGSDPVEVVGKNLGSVDPSLDPPSWLGDASGFVFSGNGMATIDGQSVFTTNGYAVGVADSSLDLVVAPPATGVNVSGMGIARDGTFLAYCLSNGGMSNVLVVDLRAQPPTTFAATSDGKSCDPRF